VGTGAVVAVGSTGAADTGEAGGVSREVGAEDATSTVGSADTAMDTAAITVTTTAAGGHTVGGYVRDMDIPIKLHRRDIFVRQILRDARLIERARHGFDPGHRASDG
jgi:hypothetical protein